MKNKSFLTLITLVWCFSAPQSLAEQPNILLIVAEDMSARVGAFGDEVARTPVLDELAMRGVRFPNTFTTAGVCAPSRAAIVTGMHQESIGAQHMRTSSSPRGSYLTVPPQAIKAFPELLRAAGYYTFTDRKLDYQFSAPFAGSGPFTIWDAQGADSDWRGRAEGQPFFGMINLLESHESALFSVGSQLSKANWTGAYVALMRSWQRFWLEERTDPADVVVPPYYPDTAEVRASIATHYDNMQLVDQQVGVWLAALERDGLQDNTIVIWTTDHGDALPRAKREVYDSGIRVPMIVVWPEDLRPRRMRPGRIDERLVSALDLAPTILDWAGAPLPNYLHGQPLLAEPKRRYVFAARDRIDSTDDRVRMIRDRRYKYLEYGYPGTPGGQHVAYRDQQPIMQALWQGLDDGTLSPGARQWFEPRPERALYVLEEDPHEMRNRAGDPRYSGVVARMRNALTNRPHADLSQPEAELAELFWPGGVQPTTAPVDFTIENGQLILTSDTAGASIGFQTGPVTEDSSWQLYTQPLEVSGGKIVAKAVRYGWRESPVSTYDVGFAEE